MVKGRTWWACSHRIDCAPHGICGGAKGGESICELKLTVNWKYKETSFVKTVVPTVFCSKVPPSRIKRHTFARGEMRSMTSILYALLIFVVSDHTHFNQ